MLKFVARTPRARFPGQAGANRQHLLDPHALRLMPDDLVNLRFPESHNALTAALLPAVLAAEQVRVVVHVPH